MRKNSLYRKKKTENYQVQKELLWQQTEYRCTKNDKYNSPQPSHILKLYNAYKKEKK